MATARERIMDRTRQGENLSALLRSQTCRDEGAAAARGLNDNGAQAQPTDEAIAFGEVPLIRRGAERVLADKSSA